MTQNIPGGFFTLPICPAFSSLQRKMEIFGKIDQTYATENPAKLKACWYCSRLTYCRMHTIIISVSAGKKIFRQCEIDAFKERR